MSDQAFIALFNGLFAFLSAAVAAYVAVQQVKQGAVLKTNTALTEKVGEQVTQAASETAAVKETLEDARSSTEAKLNEIKASAARSEDVNIATHAMVNGDRTAQLETVLGMARRIAVLTTDFAEKKTADKAVTVAEVTLNAHNSKQAKVDSIMTREESTGKNDGERHRTKETESAVTKGEIRRATKMKEK